MRQYLLLIFLIIPILWNLLKPGFYTSHDGEWMVIRLTAFHQSLKEGQFPVRWLSRLNHEYGYPVMNFLYPLPFYLAEPFYALTRDPVLAVKIVMGLAIASMAVGSYALFRKWGTAAAIIGALTYVYSPYISYNLYTRGSFGEIVAMGIVPWVFWAIQTRRFAVTSVLIAALILSHNVVAVLFFPVIVGSVIARSLRRGNPEQRDVGSPRFARQMDSLAMTFALGLGLSSFFWFPALNELKYVRASQISVSEFQNEYLQLGEAVRRTGILQSTLTFGIPLYFLTQNSSWFWDSIPGLKIIQFPWRILSVFSFIAAVVVVSLVFRLRNNKILVGVLATVVIFISFRSSWPFLRPSSFVLRPSSYYQTNDDSTTVRAEYTPVWVKELPTTRPETPTKHYYPGLKLFVNGIEQFINPGAYNGEIRSSVFGEGSKITFMWSETPLRVAADLISIFSFLIMLKLFQHSHSVIARNPESFEGRRGNLKRKTDRHGPVRRGLAMTFETSSLFLFQYRRIV